MHAVHPATAEELPSIHLLRVAMSLFGGSATSRLFRNVREKQSLCYYCGASAVRSTGVMVVDCGVEPGGEAKAEAAIRKELEDMCREPVTAEEMEQCRLSMLGSMDAVGDSLGALESWYYGAFLRGEDPITPEEGKALTAAVTAEQVRQLMRSYHYSVCYTVTAGEEGPSCRN